MRLPALALSDEDRRSLERRAASNTLPHRDVVRAQIILGAAEGKSNRQIGRELGLHYIQVGIWRKRYEARGIEGLMDRKRPGRPLVYGHEERLRIVKTICETPPDPASHWTTKSVAEALSDLGISPSQVWRICEALDLKPWQVRSWLTSHDPDFWEKAADVCGLYINPPDNAIVFSIDEKPTIQAKRRVNPTLPPEPKRIDEEGTEHPGTPTRQEFEYRRGGTACLFAALDVAKGEVTYQVKRRNRSEQFIEFLEHIDKMTPRQIKREDGSLAELTIHIVVDNGSTHVSKATKKWLKAHPRFVVHYTPTHASWLNQVELFFSILVRRLIRRGDFASVQELTDKLTAFIEAYNAKAKPFRWTYEGRPLQVA